MRKKRPHVASLDEIRISREGDMAIIEYADPDIYVTRWGVGPERHEMSDEEILERWNESLAAREAAAAEYEHIAVEVPIGRPQIEYFALGDQWTPRGDVLRCVIGGAALDDGPEIHIDEHDLSWEQFGRLLATHGGWGMRVIFVPDDELTDEPTIEVREPEKT